MIDDHYISSQGVDDTPLMDWVGSVLSPYLGLLDWVIGRGNREDGANDSRNGFNRMRNTTEEKQLLSLSVPPSYTRAGRGSASSCSYWMS